MFPWHIEDVMKEDCYFTKMIRFFSQEEGKTSDIENARNQDGWLEIVREIINVENCIYIFINRTNSN
jgi:hypothetical protein